MADLFQTLLASIDDLTDAQAKELMARLEARTAASKTTNAPELKGQQEWVSCRRCGNQKPVKWGKRDDKQRYHCKVCGCTFLSGADAQVFYSRLVKKQWLEIIKGVLLCSSIAEIAANIGVSKQTAWSNKRKVCTALQELYIAANGTEGVIVCEDGAERSFKGKRDPAFFVRHLGRMPKHHRSRDEKLDYLEKAGLLEELKKDETTLEELLSGKEDLPEPHHDRHSVLTWWQMEHANVPLKEQIELIYQYVFDCGKSAKCGI